MLGPILLLAASPSDCTEFQGIGYAAGYTPSVARQGETIELVPMSVRFHGGPTEPVPLECATDWEVKGEGVKLLPGGKIKIRADAVPGTQINYSGHIGGKGGGRGYGAFTIIGAQQKVLSGTFIVRTQQRCHTPKIAEMRFSSNGFYTYTLPADMVESMVSGSGTYRWDGDTGKIELGGTSEPFEALKTGTAKWVDGTLVLEGIDPAGSSASCQITLGGG
ncbi:MAG: hypothetical protein EOP60_08045 [Sphingomonadales bacterium]|nr:MAG: hypothetical protein EOP60_08045 [Sphingomonadales bacterium]